MSTEHKIFFTAAQNMKNVEDQSIHLMVTSPPYPIIAIWDEIFSQQSSQLDIDLIHIDSEEAFTLMNHELNQVWKEVYRVLVPGGIACINIGDATRTINKNFQLFPSHAEIIHHCRSLGFSSLPGIIWRKPTNAPNKFMGSGMLPPGAYITLEHEHILVFRKGSKREFKKDVEKEKRRKSAYFWEERNKWFSDLWEIRGTTQNLLDNSTRSRSAAFPFEIAHRLVNMFSVIDDVVLDPFLGTGTTMFAAMCNRRNSVHFEIDPNLKQTIEDGLTNIIDFGNTVIHNRLQAHYDFIMNRIVKNKPIKHFNDQYRFPVMTSQEKEISFSLLEKLTSIENGFEIYYKDYFTDEFRIEKQ
jgi:DNA modification methylase